MSINVTGRGIFIFDATGGGGGTVTGADNGLSLAGTIVELGGTLIQATTIDCGQHQFDVVGNLGAVLFHLNLWPGNDFVGAILADGFGGTTGRSGGDQNQLAMISEMTDGNITSGSYASALGNMSLRSVDATTNNEADVNVSPGGLQAYFTETGTNVFRAGLMQFPGLAVERIAVATTQTLVNQTVGTSLAGWIITIYPWLTVNTVVAGTVQITGSYTDYTGVARTFNFGVTNSLTTPIYTPIIIRVKKLTNLTIQALMTAAINCNVGVICQVIGLAPN